MADGKPTCGGALKCPYWNALEGISSIGGSVIETNGPRTEAGYGECHLNPPVPMLIAVPDRLGNAKPGQMNLYPQKHMGSVCSHHPVIALERVKVHELARLRANKEMLDWDPEKHGGAGFNFAPPLAIAKKIAAGPGTEREGGEGKAK